MSLNNTLKAGMLFVASALAGCAHTEDIKKPEGPSHNTTISDACLESREQLKSLVKTDSCEGMYLIGAQVGIHLEKCDDPTTLFGKFVTREFTKKERMCGK